MLALFAIACGPPADPPATRTSGSTETWTLPYLGGQSGEDPGYAPCGSVGVVGPDEVVTTADGDLTGADLRELADGVHLADLAWWDAPPTELRADLRWDGEIRRLGPGAATTTGCEPGLEIDGTYVLATDDGRLNEEGSATLSAVSPSVAGFTAEWLDGADTVQLEAWVDELGIHGVVWRFGQDDVVQLASFGLPER